MYIILNPIVIAVTLLIILCILKINVLISLLLSAIVAGFLSGMNARETTAILIEGMSGNGETALSYVLLGVLASAMAYTGITEILSIKLSRVIGKKKISMLIAITLIACCSQNLIPIHIAFIPILIPALLPVMNEMKLDRRGVACALTFGLKAPYIALPFGFGLIFHGIIADNLTLNGMKVVNSEVWKTTWMLGFSMIIGLLCAIYIFRKPREYSMEGSFYSKSSNDERATKLNYSHYVTLFAAIGTLVINLFTGSLPLGALTGILTLILFRAIKIKDLELIISDGIQIMGLIAIIMLVSSGYAAVMKATGSVDSLVEASIALIGNSKLTASIVIMVIGLVITLGIGSSFSTIPILALFYVPLCLRMGFSTNATILLIAAAAALGDAGSPASNTTLGPTAGLNVDNQHDHIRDTCLPTAICYNIPLALCAIVLSQFI